jgi:hypothetical protein
VALRAARPARILHLIPDGDDGTPLRRATSGPAGVFRVAVPNSAIGLAQARLPLAETGAEMLEDRLKGRGTRPIDQLARVVTLVV